MAERVGLLGGTFDPPHLGHLVVAEEARVSLKLDEVRFVVAGDPWMKSSTSPARSRVRLARAATYGDAHLAVDDREVKRSGPTYTADTLEELTEQEPGTGWFFLIGMDAVNAMPRWERVEAALKLATFVAVTRPGYAPTLPQGLAERLTTLQVPHIGVSSTDLRDRYRTGGATRYLVTDRVDALVRELDLYADRSSDTHG